MRHVAEQIRCTAAEVEDVVSYYTMFYTRPVGKYVLNVCRTLSCALLGAERVTEELSAKLGIRPGQTDAAGMFTLVEVECLGACDRAPVVMVNDDWHERLSPDQAGRLIDDIKARGAAALSGCHLHKEKSEWAAGSGQRAVRPNSSCRLPAAGCRLLDHGLRTGPHQIRQRA
jgi:NADH-quinone oxidoreductase subunit E